MTILKQLTDKIFYQPPEHETDQPVLAAIVGAEKVLMIDAGVSSDHADNFIKAFKEKTGRNVDFVVLTHWHWDHTFGLSGVKAASIGQKNIAKNLSRLVGLSWDDTSLYRRVAEGEEIAFCADCICKVYGDERNIRIKLPEIYFNKILHIDLGGITCELHHIPTDHSDDAVAVYVRSEKVLFLGDALAPNLYAKNIYFTAPAVLQLTGFIKSFSVEWLIESHQEPLKEKDFWIENTILELTAKLIDQGMADTNSLAGMLSNEYNGNPPEDYMEVIELFMNGIKIPG